MKKLFTLSVMLLMLVATVSTTSCSTEKSITSAFAKTGYQMGMLTPAQQLGVAPMLSAFPEFSQTALGYLVASKLNRARRKASKRRLDFPTECSILSKSFCQRSKFSAVAYFTDRILGFQRRSFR